MENNLIIWPDWELRELLDSGSYGFVYRAVHREHPELQSAVKLVYLPAEEEETEELQKQGLNEEQIKHYYRRVAEAYTDEMRHMALFKGTSHIVSVEDFKTIPREGETGYIVCIRMELLKSLNQYLSDKQLDEEEVIEFGIEICSALKDCHREGVLHGDIKPENIFVNDRLSNGPLFKLGDFGNAREISAGMEQQGIYGTPSYMAPEAAEGKGTDERSDIYSLGLVLYRLMNHDRLPFLPPDKTIYQQEDKSIALHMRLTGITLPVPEQASEDFSAILLKACAHDPEQRYTSATEFRDALTGLQRRRQKAQSFQRFRNMIRQPVFLVLIAILGFILISWISGMIRERNTIPSPQAATPVPLLPAEVEEPREGSFLQMEYLFQAMTYQGILTDGGVAYRVPRSMGYYPPVLTIRGIMPKLRSDFTVSPAELELSDGSAMWSILLEEKDKAPVSFLWRASRYAAATIQAEAPEDYTWLLNRAEKQGKWNAVLEGYYPADGAAPEIIQMMFIFQQRIDKAVWTVYSIDQSGEFPYDLKLSSEGRTTLQAAYDTDGQLRKVTYLRQEYEIDPQDSLPEIEGVEWIP